MRSLNYMKLVGLVGRRRAGKDTAAAALLENGYTLIKFADPLKNMLREYLRYVGLSAEIIERMIEGDLKETPSYYLGGKTCRFCMQRLGTEYGRDMLSEDIWVNAAIARAYQVDKAILTDVRFKNEASAIKAAGGILIKIIRPEGTIDSHASESFIDEIQTDYIITNDTTIGQLHQLMLDIIQKQNQ